MNIKSNKVACVIRGQSAGQVGSTMAKVVIQPLNDGKSRVSALVLKENFNVDIQGVVISTHNQDITLEMASDGGAYFLSKSQVIQLSSTDLLSSQLSVRALKLDKSTRDLGRCDVALSDPFKNETLYAMTYYSNSRLSALDTSTILLGALVTLIAIVLIVFLVVTICKRKDKKSFLPLQKEGRDGYDGVSNRQIDSPSASTVRLRSQTFISQHNEPPRLSPTHKELINRQDKNDADGIESHSP